MISKTRDPFISLVKKNESSEAVATEGPRPEPRGPSLYISDVKLPIADEDLDQILVAEVKLKVERIVKRMENGETSNQYDFEVKGIRFKG